MRTSRLALQFLLAFLLVTFTNATFAGQPIFRYKNDAGVKVTTYVLPPEMAGKGYEIINSKGDVLETVKPAPTPEEMQAFISSIEQKKYDKTLLLKYGSLAELMTAQKRKSAELDAKMSVLKSSYNNIKNQIDLEQQKAANYERQGQPVPETSLKTLEDLYAQYEQMEGSLREREKEMATERVRYEYELNRYKELKNLK
jgi:hypothetical protein